MKPLLWRGGRWERKKGAWRNFFYDFVNISKKNPNFAKTNSIIIIHQKNKYHEQIIE
jgi:hypothetical protein